MGTFLFDDIIFGPVKSRRFGVSLGINLLPVDYKYCTFNCIYCECGWTNKNDFKKTKLPTAEQILSRFRGKINEMAVKMIIPDHITFAGNGEPTIHPEFAKIIDATIALRNEHFPKAEITVLSNATQIHKKNVFEALDQVDNNVLKLDTVIKETFDLLNNAVGRYSLEKIIREIKKFEGRQIIQTLFMRGIYKGKVVDNTTEEEVAAWVEVLKEINPRYVMIYPIDRDTPLQGLEKISKKKLDQIASAVKAAGIDARVYY